MNEFLKRIILSAISFAEERIKDNEDEVAALLLENVIPKDSILFIFSREIDGMRKIEDVWFAF